MIPDQVQPGIRINARGFRGPEWTTGEGALKVVVLGGSVAFGSGATADTATFPGRLESLLREALGETVEVWNTGHSGYMTTQEVILWMTEILPLRPDIVVTFDGVNDFYAHWSTRDRSDVPMVFPQLEARVRAPFRAAAASLLERSVLLKAAALRIRRHLIPAPSAADADEAARIARVSAEVLRRNYDALLALVPETVPVVLCLQPILVEGAKPFSEEEATLAAVWDANNPGVDAAARAAYEAYRREMAEIGRRCPGRVRFIDLSNAFAEIPRTVFIDHCHFGDEGYDLLARRAAPVVLEALGAAPAAATMAARP
jgi:lysophospholipase L1-like esterase